MAYFAVFKQGGSYVADAPKAVFQFHDGYYSTTGPARRLEHVIVELDGKSPGELEAAAQALPLTIGTAEAAQRLHEQGFNAMPVLLLPAQQNHGYYTRQDLRMKATEKRN